MSDSPPSSWYDPPEPRWNLEIKSEKPVRPGETCEKCEEVAHMEVVVNDERYHGGTPVTVCKNHYDTIIDDTYEDMANYEPDYDEED